MSLEKVVYTAKATATGGRDGRATSSDGVLDVKLGVPKEMGGAGGEATNPEQLFAAGYSACFLGAMKFVAGRDKITMPERLVSFSSYNIFTIAALIGSSDLVGIMPARMFTLLRNCWPLEQIPFAQLNAETAEISLYYNKLSLRDPVLENVINVIRQTF
jgi:DNA-binding transcriptional LysR family regulator